MLTTARQLSDRIVVSRDVLHGKPRVAGTRILISSEHYRTRRKEQPA